MVPQYYSGILSITPPPTAPLYSRGMDHLDSHSCASLGVWFTITRKYLWLDIAFIKDHVSQRMVYFVDLVVDCHVAINIPWLIGGRSSRED